MTLQIIAKTRIWLAGFRVVEMVRGQSRKTLIDLVSPLVLGLVIGVLVCAPFFRGGWLLLLDWVIGPHSPVLGSTFYGLNGGINVDFLFWIVSSSLVHLFGSAMTWMPIFLFFPIGAFSISRLMVRQPLPSQLLAALFFVINPFVVERIYAGQLGVIYGYALLPILIKWSYEWISEDRPKVRQLALLLTLMVSIDVHYAWIGGVVIAVAVLLGLGRSHAFHMSILRLALLVILLNIYLLVPVLGHPLPVNPTYNGSMLAAFQTVPDKHLGLLLNVLGLYGFWRHMRVSSKNLVSGWTFFLGAILILSGYGISQMWRDSRRFTRFVLLISSLGYFLALGAQGPIGGIFHWAYDYIPGFSMMREPEKFSGLVATAMSFFLGIGISTLWRNQKSKSVSLAVIILGIFVEVGYNPVIFWGLHGQVKTSSIPVGWSTVSRTVASASGYTLVLPWNMYLAFPFTENRIIDNPAQAFLGPKVISGDNIQVGGVQTISTSLRSTYIGRVISHLGQSSNVGELLAPLGVEYIVIFKAYATGNLEWVHTQRDLSTIYNSPSAIVLKNGSFRGLAQEVNAPIYYSSQEDPINATKVFLRGVSNSQFATPVTGDKSVLVRLSAKRPGWINISRPFANGWQSRGEAALPSAFGTMLVHARSSSVLLSYGPWNWILVGYLVSAFGVISVVFSYTLDRYATRINNSGHSSAPA